MTSSFDLLRSGKPIQLKNGAYARLNLDDKTLETSEGQKIYVGDNPKYFPVESELPRLREKEALESEIKQRPAGEFLYQFGNQGLASAAKGWLNKFTKSPEAYKQTQEIGQEVGREISEESPITSGAATVASFVPDIIATRGMSALKAAPLLAASHAGPRILEEPGEVAKEATIGAAGGYLIDKGAAALNRIAQRRATVRGFPEQLENVRKSNIEQQELVNKSNMGVKQQHAQALENYQKDLNARENLILKQKNDYAQQSMQRDAEIVRLKNQAAKDKAERNANAAKSQAEYEKAKNLADQENRRVSNQFKRDQEEYEKALKQLPEMQKKAQAEYSEGVVKTAQEIEGKFPKNSRFSSSDLQISNFIEDNINKSSIAGSSEASQSRRILNSIFPKDEILTGKSLAQRYKALEGAIQKATPEVQAVLNDFKSHLGNRLRTVLEDNVAYNKVYPSIKKTLATDVNAILKDVIADEGWSKSANDYLVKVAKSRVDELFKTELTPSGFIARLRSGEMPADIAKKILSTEDFLHGFSKAELKHMEKIGTFPYVMKEAERRLNYFTESLQNKIENRLAKLELSATKLARDTGKDFARDIKKTYGLAEPVTVPNAPQMGSQVPMPSIPAELPEVPPITLPQPISPPQVPIMPTKPTMGPLQTFSPQAEPVLQPAQGFAESAADFLERNLLGGKGLVNNPITKLAGLKYLAGGAALPLEAGYLGAKALTSPTAFGEAARMTFKQGGIQAIDAWAQRYPSYNNGILQDPFDRRSLSREIEDAQDIPIEQKAVLQSKVNRGRPLESKL